MNEGIIPYKDVYFIIDTSHECECHAVAGVPNKTKNFRKNISNFIYILYKNKKIKFKAEKVSATRYHVFPTEDLPFDGELEVGLAPVNDDIYLLSKSGNAELIEKWYNKFRVQPELKIQIIFKGTDYIEIEANQALDRDSVMDNDNYYIEVLEQ
jgi:hypothetical protein